jgi:aspartyl-tRNA(Asn)/glutamyl-tRNA(Gln) amidotransferase subunit C
MVITEEDVEHISKLACIEISDKEKGLFVKNFNSILDYFKELDEVNTDNVEPTYHVIGLTNVFREDETGESLSQEEALKNTQRTDKGYFKGPRIV